MNKIYNYLNLAHIIYIFIYMIYIHIFRKGIILDNRWYFLQKHAFKGNYWKWIISRCWTPICLSKYLGSLEHLFLWKLKVFKYQFLLIYLPKIVNISESEFLQDINMRKSQYKQSKPTNLLFYSTSPCKCQVLKALSTQDFSEPFPILFTTIDFKSLPFHSFTDFSLQAHQESLLLFPNYEFFISDKKCFFFSLLVSLESICYFNYLFPILASLQFQILLDT